MDDPYQLCELYRHADYATLSDVAEILEARGIDADVWPVKGRRSVPWASRVSRLMVRCGDLVYARWIAAGAGLDTWPESGVD
jgi:hypothetical protein